MTALLQALPCYARARLSGGGVLGFLLPLLFLWFITYSVLRPRGSTASLTTSPFTPHAQQPQVNQQNPKNMPRLAPSAGVALVLVLATAGTAHAQQVCSYVVG